MLCNCAHLHTRPWTSLESTFPSSHSAKFGLWQRHCETAVTQCLWHTIRQKVLVKWIHLRERDQLKMHNKDQSLLSKPHQTAEYKCWFPHWKIQYVGSHTGQRCTHELWSIYHFRHQSADILT